MKKLILIAGLVLYSNMVWATHEVCIAVYPPPPECVHDDDDSNSAAIIAAVAVVGGLIYYATKKRSKKNILAFQKKELSLVGRLNLFPCLTNRGQNFSEEETPCKSNVVFFFSMIFS